MFDQLRTTGDADLAGRRITRRNLKFGQLEKTQGSWFTGTVWVWLLLRTRVMLTWVESLLLANVRTLPNPSQPLPGESGCSIPRVSRVVEVTPNSASVLVGHSGAEHVVVAQRRHAGIYDSKENLSKSQQPFLRKIYWPSRSKLQYKIISSSPQVIRYKLSILFAHPFRMIQLFHQLAFRILHLFAYLWNSLTLTFCRSRDLF